MPLVHNTSSFANSTEYQKHVDTVLKEELRDLHADIPNFFEAYFGDITGLDSTARAVLDKCREGDSPLYTEDKGWKNWPETAVKKKVLKWLADVIRNLMEFTEAHNSTQKISWRPLAQPSQSLKGSGLKQKLDISFVDDLNATITSKCHWSQIIVLGELKCNPTYDCLSSAWLDLGRSTNPVKLVLEQLDIDITKFAEKFTPFTIWKLANIHSEEQPFFHIIQQHKWEAKWIVLFN
uniref:Fungal-type protein kinase domain-containing protein n=1 Tax=Coccidioides posadasii RMSCC 3488 TaxID=454284 RepID=A0A0J6IBD0_COCPO|nr:hypothetical protein CPAG_05280 [Coccidioides posadasii RMSCC 3488]